MAEMRNRNGGDAPIDLRAAGPAQEAPTDGLRKYVNLPFGTLVTPVVGVGWQRPPRTPITAARHTRNERVSRQLLVSHQRLVPPGEPLAGQSLKIIG